MQRIFFKRTVSWAGLLTIGAALAACAPVSFDEGGFQETATTQNAQLEKSIQVNKVTPTVVVDFDPGRSGLDDLDKGRLLGFIEAQNIGFGEKVEVELPPFEGADGINERRFGELAGFLQDRGFEVTPKITNELGTNSLRVYFVKYVATVDPVCEKGWYKPRGLGYENLPLPFLGCATASAFAGMVADPKDLVDPSHGSAADGERAAKAVEQYRAGSAGASGASSQ